MYHGTMIQWAIFLLVLLPSQWLPSSFSSSNANNLLFIHAAVAYPGIWSGRQPSGESTGMGQVLIGTPSYSFAVVETDLTFYPTIQDPKDGTIKYAELDPHSGRYRPSKYTVGGQGDGANPDALDDLEDAQVESPHVVHAKCLELDYCKWKVQHDAQQRNENMKPLVSEGTVVNFVIPFLFSNHVAADTASSSASRPPQQQHPEPIAIEELDTLLFNGEERSVRDYFLQQSYGKLEMVTEVAPWVTIPYTEQECSDGKSGRTITLHQCLHAALEQVAKVMTTTDLTSLLAPATRQEMAVTFVHSGYAAEFGGNDPAGTWYENRIWSHAWEIDSPLYQGRYALISDKYGRTNRHINRVGVAVHEIAQVLGAPTLYGTYPGYGLGYYDMMSNPWGFDGTLINCGAMSPYTKHLFGWITLEEITTNGKFELTHSFTEPKIYVIRQGYPTGEYLLIENRQEEGYDNGLSQPGLAIYHIDEQANNFGSHPGDKDFPRDHYVAALIQGDGRFDLERMEDEGDSGDLFHAGRFSGVGPEGAFLGDGSLSIFQGGFPNTKGYQGGMLRDSGVTIQNITVPSGVMSFTVYFSSPSVS
jgi:M6 family metalloprotease-like protein